MASGKFVSYLRVSTKRQGASGLGVEARRMAVTNYLNGGRWKLVSDSLRSSPASVTTVQRSNRL
jgi:DNA invertase Pin-like site-specific DNA recombinase